MFKLSELGLWWSQARTVIRGGTQYSRSKFVLHVELNNSDIPKVSNIEDYFSRSSKKVDNNLLGVPMTFVLAFDISSSDEIKNRIIDNSKTQEHLGNSIKSTTVSGIQLNN